MLKLFFKSCRKQLSGQSFKDGDCPTLLKPGFNNCTECFQMLLRILTEDQGIARKFNKDLLLDFVNDDLRVCEQLSVVLLTFNSSPARLSEQTEPCRTKDWVLSPWRRREGKKQPQQGRDSVLMKRCCRRILLSSLNISDESSDKDHQWIISSAKSKVKDFNGN